MPCAHLGLLPSHADHLPSLPKQSSAGSRLSPSEIQQCRNRFCAQKPPAPLEWMRLVCFRLLWLSQLLSKKHTPRDGRGNGTREETPEITSFMNPMQARGSRACLSRQGGWHRSPFPAAAQGSCGRGVPRTTVWYLAPLATAQDATLQFLTWWRRESRRNDDLFANIFQRAPKLF